MIQLKKSCGTVVAGDVRNAFNAVDDALLNGARMYASVLEATQGSNLPAQQTQKLLCSMTAGLSAIVEGRAGIVSAASLMTAIKSRSNLAEECYGCPDGWDALPTPAAKADANRRERA